MLTPFPAFTLIGWGIYLSPLSCAVGVNSIRRPPQHFVGTFGGA
jgi:hypothetical protein